MSGRKLLRRVLAVLICIALLSAELFASAAVLTFETQYDYDEADIAWLTDLVIKEDMTSVEGMAQRVELVPAPEYPYDETPDSFEKDVKYFTSLYNLEVGSQHAGYIYFFEVLNAQSELLAADFSDADIKEYLEGVGVSYPANADSDEKVMARALFLAFSTGSLGSDFYQSNQTLEELAAKYLANLTGMNTDALKDWMPEGSILSFDEYLLAVSKLTLWSNGYDVSVDTPADEVYRLIAVMTVKAQGISISSDLPFSELNLKYIAALLGKKYSVSIDSTKLGAAIAKDSVPFYILQLMGRRNGISIREDNATYEEAFYLVADNTDIFDVASDDFYADIYLYDAYLTNKCDSLWIYPTAYSTNNSTYIPVVTVNGLPVKNNYYNEIQILPDEDVQSLSVKVFVSGGGRKSECTYVVRVHQGEGRPEENVPSTESGTEEHSYVSSDSLVAGVLSSMGVNSVISSILDRSYVSLPTGLSGIVSFIAPTFDEGTTGGNSVSVGESEGKDDSFYYSVLDEIGALVNTEIKGIPGIEFSGDIASLKDKYVTFE